MKRGLQWGLYWLLLTWVSVARGQAPPGTCVRYTLVEGSYFVDDCLACDRPTIKQALRGSFDLVLLQDTAPYTKYAVKNIDFVAGAGSSLERRLSGEGTYERFEEFAVLQDMSLALVVKDAYTNQPVYFTNDSRAVVMPFPLVQAGLAQTNGTGLQMFSLQLLAAPVREIWFSTAKAFTSTNLSAPTNKLSGGDLLSNRGRVVRRNHDLLARIGIMPAVPDLGLDAVQVTSKGEILFSLPVDVFSETLGPIQHGDLLSDRGALLKRNQDLLAAFHPASTADAGLDGFQPMPDGELLFSIQSNVAVSAALTLSGGDILSDRGQVYLKNQQLLANFQPSLTNHDFGLDAFYVFPSGEIWFAVAEGFTDGRIGPVQPGDLLSSLGYRVFSNQDLLAAFAPAEPAVDYGLDGLFVVTDTQPPRPPPVIQKATLSNGQMTLSWTGDGSVFQLQAASSLTGPWVPCTDIVPDLSANVAIASQAPRSSFFRVQQW